VPDAVLQKSRHIDEQLNAIVVDMRSLLTMTTARKTP